MHADRRCWPLAAAEASSRIACPACPLLQKCATTSLYFHLRHHPQMRAAYDKVGACLRVTHAGRWSCCVLQSPPPLLHDSHPSPPNLIPPNLILFVCWQEPEYFTETCNNQPEACPADTQRQYIEKVCVLIWRARECELFLGSTGAAGQLP